MSANTMPARTTIDRSYDPKDAAVAIAPSAAEYRDQYPLPRPLSSLGDGPTCAHKKKDAGDLGVGDVVEGESNGKE
ncbi:hypothetical protein MRS44_004447 [Fusarium solani]|uniref:uncharacterized protein n=1 Tax=Fusarium solani TaxID=169388 RepID=UPI0032C4A323|nr:hypothetical protein MRS44_004447 [Fusarium solani]